MSAISLHEAEAALRATTVDEHRAYRSLMEELEAIDWYAQRIDASSDPQLKKVLEHNRDEEKEHAAMVLEWLRRRDAVLDRHLRAYLFSQGPIEGLERIQEAKENDPSTSVEPSAGVEVGLGIGSLRERRG